MAAALRVLIAAASAEGGGGGLADVNLGLTIWTIVLFALFAAVLAKFGWGPLLRAVEEREKNIRDAVEGAHKANSEAQALLAQQREELAQARREREEIIKQAIAEAQQMRTELMAQARADSEHLLQKAREQIERETRIALQEIRAHVADLAIEAAGKIVASSLTPEAQRKLVEDFIAKLPTTAS
ncbi:MAG TPA: F0F1 ATP synthase subunit B [Vicinamibacteria bacterium]|jgi:F-type H+-transporting ATPase subunit b